MVHFTANASFLYPNHAPHFDVITRLHQNTETPFDEDSLHATSHSAILIATLPSQVLVEAATGRCPMTGKLRVEYHSGCQLGTRKGAMDALLLRTEIMVNDKMEEIGAGLTLRLRRASTETPSKRRKSSWVSEGGDVGIGSWSNSRRRSMIDGEHDGTLTWDFAKNGNRRVS